MSALRIVYPPSSYQDAFQRAKIARLEDRRNELCMRTFDEITKGGPLLRHITPIKAFAHDYALGRFLNVKLSVLGEACSLILS